VRSDRHADECDGQETPVKEHGHSPHLLKMPLKK
jgi:hypothetical protein